MKKLLCIEVNSKPKELSTSKQVGEEFANRFLKKNPNYSLTVLDLYKEDIPEINYKVFTGRGEPVSGDEYEKLAPEDKKIVDRVNELSDQFLNADTYVITAPMWSVDCPSRLKRYIDCIVINNKLIKITSEEVTGLLGDKERDMVYIQSSGGIYPKIFDSKFNHAVHYCEDLFKFLGIKNFEKILVEGVDMPEIGKEKAMAKAHKDMDAIIDKI